ncbi:MAG: prepilin-type N-terminal cleavage/methylation domain-containing protein [Candidatus Portnoybacteria bacterium]|nr:prepilin-type N-terminal cleavage/methylation domain-containing protein [Candidatus Portnoybacteria bacterium]
MNKSQKGFSLIELMIVMFIFVLGISVLFSLVVYSYRGHAYVFQQATAINEARRGVETMVKEIREAKTGEDGSYAIDQAGDFEFVFYSDIDSDDSVERIRYFLDGSDFKKGVVEPSGDPPEYVLAGETFSVLSYYVRNGITTPVFSYYNGDWPQDTVNNPLPTLTRLTDTKLMHVFLKINVDPARPPDNFELESDTQIRNLKTNL